MFSNSSIVVQGGTLINHSSTNLRTSKGMDILKKWVATGALHNSRELYDAPKCHPQTRIAVLDDIINWVSQSESTREDSMLWLFGSAGAGKSAIAKRIAEIAAEMDMLIATFFFSRMSPTRRTEDRLVATLAYQLAVLFPDIRSHVEDAIERDPVIFHKTILTQIDTLLLRPLQSVLPTQTVPSQKLIIIDGLDECNDSQSQISILEAISRSFFQHDLPIKFLVVSRPEIHLVNLFASNELLKSVHRRLALDDTYRPDDDIRLFLSEKFEHIKLTHPLRSEIPVCWPTEEELETLIAKSSGQFIYASTVVKFVESICHQPTVRLNTILGILPPGGLYTNGTVHAHPLLVMSGVTYDLIEHPSTITTRNNNPLSSLTLHHQSTTPPLSFITITSIHLPWVIKVYASNGIYTTVQDIFDSIYHSLRTNVTNAEFNLLPSNDDRQRVTRAYEKRYRRFRKSKAYEEEKRGGMKQVDFLMGVTKFLGISNTSRRPDEWWLHIA